MHVLNARWVMRAWFPLVILLVLAPLAGCVGSDAPSEADPTSPSATQAPSEASQGLTAPTWRLGDHWTYQSNPSGEVTFVVTGETSSGWILDTTSREVAFLDARSDVSFLGERDKATLAGSQNGTEVAYFDWPLVEGKSWTTTWDGVEREITVDRVEDQTARLTARQGDRLAVEYTYDADAKTMASFTFYDANGTETASAELRSTGENFTGTTVRWELATIVDREETFGAAPDSWGDSFEMPPNATDLWLSETVRCPSGVFAFGVSHNDTGYGDTATCPHEADVAGPIVEDPEPGEWSYGLTATSPQGEGAYDITLIVRTLVEVAVAEG